MLKSVLLVLHVAGGTTALLGAVGAVLTQVLRTPHRFHVIAGRGFIGGMLLVCGTSLPLAYLVDSVFLALIGIFSGYLTLAGWRLARNRTGRVGPFDWAVHAALAVAFVGMAGRGATTLAGDGAVLLVFGLIGLMLALLNLRWLRRGPIRGRSRIARHITMVFAATTAAVTAFLVVNGPFGIADWFLPTVLLTPVGMVWSRRVRAGRATTLDRTGPAAT